MIPKNEYAPYYGRYIEPLLDNGKSLLENLEFSQKEFIEVVKDIPESKKDYAYDYGKWTINELILHVIDTERVFCYRALAFARGEQQNLPGFDQDVFVNNSFANSRSLAELVNEMNTLRQSTIQLFESFNDDVLLNKGNASGNIMSVRALGYLFSGHQLHHLKVLKERYL